MAPRNGAGCCSTLLLILMATRSLLVGKGIMPCNRPTPVSKIQPVSDFIQKCVYRLQVNTMEPHYNYKDDLNREETLLVPVLTITSYSFYL